MKSNKNLVQDVQVRTSKDYPWQVLSALIHDHRYSLTLHEIAKALAVVRSRSTDRLEQLAEEWGAQRIPPEGLPISNFIARYQVISLLKKFRFPGSQDSRRSVAVQKFLAAEETCRLFNSQTASEFWQSYSSNMITAEIFAETKRVLRKMLGSALPARDKLTEWSRHGPGANLDTMHGCTSLYDKYNEYPYSCTSNAACYARLSIEDDERWYGALQDKYRRDHNIPMHIPLDQEHFWNSVLNIVDHNRIAFVPKNSKTDRSIAIEPSLNLYLQLGVDGFIRRRLKRWDVDLDCQKKNQRLAKCGSNNWMAQDPLVTLDLAAASDTVSIRICRELLPSQWYHYLMEIRSPNGVLDGESLEYQKISSMGNGYTFALESAIFAAITIATTTVVRGSIDRDDYAIFGDDIICRRSVVDRVIEMLSICGFSVNPDKSFLTGPFRESCGADFLAGTPVRPVFLVESPTTTLGLWCDLNRLRRHLALRRGDEWTSTACDYIKTFVPPRFRGIQGPCSDETFDTYEQVPTPISRSRDGLWKFYFLVASDGSRNGKELHMRKLMHSLRAGVISESSPWASRSWGGMRITGNGSRFAVTRRNLVTVSVSPGQTSVWSDQYNEQNLWP